MSETTPTSAVPTAATPNPTATQPALPQPDEEIDRNDPKVQSAVGFLRDSRVRLTSQENKIQFLKEKGLSAAQIKYAFSQAGQTVSLEKISAVQSRPQAPRSLSAPATQPPPATTSQALLLRSGEAPRRTHTLYPVNVPPQEVPQSTWDWRDVVIGAGAATIAAVGGFKLFQRYSPYEIRRKGDGAAAQQGRRHLMGRAAGKARRYAAASSDTGEDRLFTAPASAAAATAPAAPPPLPQAPAAADKDEEVKRLEKELAETKEALAADRKRSAELSLSLAKVRSEKQQITHKNDKLSQRIDDLEEQIKKMEAAQKEAENEKNKGEEEEENRSGGATDAEGSPDGDGETPREVFGEGAGETIPAGLESLLPRAENTPDSDGATPTGLPVENGQREGAAAAAQAESEDVVTGEPVGKTSDSPASPQPVTATQ